MSKNKQPRQKPAAEATRDAHARTRENANPRDCRDEAESHNEGIRQNGQEPVFDLAREEGIAEELDDWIDLYAGRLVDALVDALRTSFARPDRQKAARWLRRKRAKGYSDTEILYACVSLSERAGFRQPYRLLNLKLQDARGGASKPSSVQGTRLVGSPNRPPEYQPDYK